MWHWVGLFERETPRNRVWNAAEVNIIRMKDLVPGQLRIAPRSPPIPSGP
jgi:hypothetical protein